MIIQLCTIQSVTMLTVCPDINILEYMTTIVAFVQAT